MRRLVVLTLLAGFLAAPAWGDDLMSVYRMAEKNDPLVRQALATRDAALEAKPQARAGLLPSLGLVGDVSRNRYDKVDGPTATSTNKSYTLNLTQPLYHRATYIELKQADNTVQQADATYEAAQQALILRVAQAYFNILVAQDSLTFARAEKQAIARQLEQAKQRFKVGLSAITDVEEAQSRNDLAVTQEISAENDLASAHEALREIIGVDTSALPTLGSNLPLVAPDPASPAAWVKNALDNNLGLMAQEATTRIAAEQVQRVRSGHYPTVDLTADYGYQNTNLSGLFALKQYTGAVGVQLNVPLYSGGLVTSQTRQAAHQYEAAQQGLLELRRATERQARDSYRGVVLGISQVKAYQAALKSTETALKAAQAGFDVGTRTIVDVLDAQQALYGARRDYANSRYNYLLSTLRLKQAAGGLAVTDIQKINALLTQAGTGGDPGTGAMDNGAH